MWCNFLFVRHQSDLKTLLYKEFYELVWFKEKYRGRYSSTIVFSAVGPIWLGRWLKQKIEQKLYTAMSFSMFSLCFEKKILVAMVPINFSGDIILSNHFDTKFAFVGVQNKKAGNFYLVAVNNKAIGGRLPLESNWQSRTMFLIIHLKDSQFCVKYSCLLPKSKLHNH